MGRRGVSDNVGSLLPPATEIVCEKAVAFSALYPSRAKIRS